MLLVLTVRRPVAGTESTLYHCGVSDEIYHHGISGTPQEIGNGAPTEPAHQGRGEAVTVTDLHVVVPTGRVGLHLKRRESVNINSEIHVSLYHQNRNSSISIQ